MAYPEDALAAHEELILKLHPHWWYMAKAGLAFVLTMAVGIWLLIATTTSILRTVLLLALVVEGIWFVERVLRWINTTFVLTSDRVMSRSGIIAKRGVEIPLARINTVRFDQGPFERLLGLGNLVIESASTGGSQVFKVVQDPSEIQRQISIQMERKVNRSSDALSTILSAAVDTPAAPTLTDQVNELAVLRDQGHLTEAEFEAKKQELLDRM